MGPLLTLLLAAGPSWAQDPLAPPPAVTPAVLDDVGRWEQAARVLLDGPPGCVEVQGTATFQVAFFSPGGWLGPGERRDLVSKGHFEGRLQGGTWTALRTTWDPVEDGDALHIDQVHPIVGKVQPAADAPAPDPPGKGSVSISSSGSGTSIDVAGGSEGALGLLDQIMHDIDPAVTTAYASWEGERRSVVLHQLVPLEHDGGDLEVQVSFPEGGPPLSLDAVFPPRVRAGDGLVKMRVLDAQLHLRSRNTELGVLPGEEGASMVVGVLGYTLGVDQRLSYDRARACPAAP